MYSQVTRIINTSLKSTPTRQQPSFPSDSAGHASFGEHTIAFVLGRSPSPPPLFATLRHLKKKHNFLAPELIPDNIFLREKNRPHTATTAAATAVVHTPLSRALCLMRRPPPFAAGSGFPT